MKTCTITLLVIVALSSAWGRPHTHKSSDHTQLSTRWSSNLHRRSAHHKSISSRDTRSHPKRGSSEYNELKYHEAHRLADAGEKYDSSSQEDDDCSDLSDSSDEESHFQKDPSDLSIYKIGHNSSVSEIPPRSFSTDSNPTYDHSSSGKPSRHEISINLNQPSNPKHTSQASSTPYPSNVHTPKVEKHHDSHHSDSSSSYVASHKHLDKPSYGSSSGGYLGMATFYLQDGNPGACGKTYQDSDFIVAIQSSMYDGGKFCGKRIRVTRKSTGRSIVCIGADECPGCPTNQSLDLSQSAFTALGEKDEGVFGITWEVLD